ncbi:acyltransferase [Candidatus Dependentiae bacterium]|nr:acyltransferase [Candidatus Dependentiae bacterium]
MKFSKDAWENIYKRSWKDGLGEFICDIIKFIPRGIKHDSCLNKIRRYIYKLCGIEIGLRSYIYHGVTTICPSNIKIGNDSFINYGGLLSAYSDIKIGNRVSIGYNCSIITESHNLESPDFEIEIKPIIIEDNVWIGSDVTLLPGTHIFEGAVIAAGSVVKGNVDKYCVFAGIPAKKIKERKIKQ